MFNVYTEPNGKIYVQSRWSCAFWELRPQLQVDLLVIALYLIILIIMGCIYTAIIFQTNFSNLSSTNSTSLSAPLSHQTLYTPSRPHQRKHPFPSQVIELNSCSLRCVWTCLWHERLQVWPVRIRTTILLPQILFKGRITSALLFGCCW